MDYFDECIAIDVIEDALTGIDVPHGRGVATGPGGTFHMCGLIDEDQWEAF